MHGFVDVAMCRRMFLCRHQLFTSAYVSCIEILLSFGIASLGNFKIKVFLSAVSLTFVWIIVDAILENG